MKMTPEIACTGMIRIIDSIKTNNKPMTELQLYKFVNTHQLEYNYVLDSEGNDSDVILFVDFEVLKEFAYLLMTGFCTPNFDRNCFLRANSIGIRMKEICEYLDINLKEVFETKDESIN